MNEPSGRPPSYQRLLAELKRRHVFRVAAVYGAAGFVLLQVVELLVPVLLLPEWTFRLVGLLLLLGFPVAIILAWAFELTPEGVKKTLDAEPGQITEIIAAPRRKRWPSGIAALAGTLLFLGGAWWMLGRGGPAGQAGDEGGGPSTDAEPALAVLPFDNLSGDPETQPFTDGVHDDLLTQLSKIRSLKVISRTSVLEYRERTKNVRQIAAELGVGHVLEGGVQRAGNQYRINVQLIDAATDQHVWSEQYGGELTVASIFATQTEIAAAITEALRAQLTPRERESIARPPSNDLEAYELYLRAREYYTLRFVESNLRTVDILAAQAIERDSSFAEAYALRSAARSVLYWLFIDRSDSIRDSAYELARQALRLRPDLPEGHWAMGHWHYRAHLDYDRALAELELAIEGRPGESSFVRVSGDVLRRKGDMEGALRRYMRAAELDPRNSNALATAGETLALLRRYHEAEEWLLRTIRQEPAFDVPYAHLAASRLRVAGDTSGAREWLERARSLGVPVERSPFNIVDLCLIAGEPDQVLTELRTTPRTVDNQFRYIPPSLYAGLAWRQKGDGARAGAAFDSAAAVLAELVSADPEEPRYRSSLGMALAGLGRYEEAIREGEEGVRLMPPEREAWRGVHRVADLARILAMAGRVDEAVDRLAYLLSVPGDLSVWDLRLDPAWDRLRGDPRFEQLARIGSLGESSGP